MNKKTNVLNWAIANNLFILLFILMIFFAFIDYFQIRTFFQIDSVLGWELYHQNQQPVLMILWIALIVLPIFVYWLFTRDWSETLGLLSAGLIMLFAGVEDVFFFFFSPEKMTNNMCWFNEVRAPVGIFSELLGHECVHALDLMTFAVLGTVIAYFVYSWLKKIEFKNF